MDTATWLKDQLRYPEDLFEKQLEVNYIYHVQNPSTWRRGDDFHERPQDGNLFYIETDLGEGIEYVGLDLVEYQGQTATLLAGAYMVRHGDHFGEAIFYYTRGSTQNFVGPKTARETYGSEATQEISLISGARNGNTLIYPLGGSIYYYIPTYSTQGSLQDLKLAGFVEAFTRDVGYGANALEAYNALNITEAVTTSNISLTYDFAMDSSSTVGFDPLTGLGQKSELHPGLRSRAHRYGSDPEFRCSFPALRGVFHRGCEPYIVPGPPEIRSGIDSAESHRKHRLRDATGHPRRTIRRRATGWRPA